jgi:hypothetical protein
MRLKDPIRPYEVAYLFSVFAESLPLPARDERGRVGEGESRDSPFDGASSPRPFSGNEGEGEENKAPLNRHEVAFLILRRRVQKRVNFRQVRQSLGGIGQLMFGIEFSFPWTARLEMNERFYMPTTTVPKSKPVIRARTAAFAPTPKPPAETRPSQTKFIKWFSDIRIEDIPLVGGKNASLGEMYRELTPQRPNGNMLSFGKGFEVADSQSAQPFRSFTNLHFWPGLCSFRRARRNAIRPAIFPPSWSIH